MIIKSKKIKKLSSVLALSLTLLGTVTPTVYNGYNVVYADNEENSEEDTQIEGGVSRGVGQDAQHSGNIFSKNNATATKTMFSATKYSEYLQYVNTFQVLNSTSGGENNILSLYSGDEGESFSGDLGEKIKGLYEEKKLFSAESLKEDTDMVKPEDVYEDASNQGAIESKDDTQVTSIEGKDAIADASLVFAKEASEELVNLFDKHLSLGVTSNDVITHPIWGMQDRGRTLGMGKYIPQEQMDDATYVSKPVQEGGHYNTVSILTSKDFVSKLGKGGDSQEKKRFKLNIQDALVQMMISSKLEEIDEAKILDILDTSELYYLNEKTREGILHRENSSAPTCKVKFDNEEDGCKVWEGDNTTSHGNSIGGVMFGNFRLNGMTVRAGTFKGLTDALYDHTVGAAAQLIHDTKEAITTALNGEPEKVDLFTHMASTANGNITQAEWTAKGGLGALFGLGSKFIGTIPAAFKSTPNFTGGESTPEVLVEWENVDGWTPYFKERLTSVATVTPGIGLTFSSAPGSVLDGSTNYAESAQKYMKSAGYKIISVAYHSIYNSMLKSGTSEQAKSKLGAFQTDVKSMVGKLSGMESYKNAISLINNNSLDLGGEYAAESWTPLIPEVHFPKTGDDGEGRAYFEEYLGKSKGKYSLTTSGFIRGVNGGNYRPVLAMDIVPAKDNDVVSPVLYGWGSLSDSSMTYTNDVKTTIHIGGKDGALLDIPSTRQLVGGSGELGKTTLINGFKVFEDWSSHNTIPYELELTDWNYRLTRMQAGAPNTIGETFARNNQNVDAVIGIDNYGNIFNTVSGDIYTPYWQTKEVGNEGWIPYSPFTNAYKTVKGYNNINKETFTPIVTEKMKSYTSGVPEIDNGLKVLRTEIVKSSTMEALTENLTKGVGGYTPTETKQLLAVLIVGGYKDNVKAFNEKIISSAKDGGQLYMAAGEGTDLRGMDKEDEAKEVEEFMARWTAASIIQKIGQIFDYGIAETLRLTIVQSSVRTYNSDIANAGLSEVFYTKTAADSESWDTILEILAVILGGILGLFVLATGFKAFRGKFDGGLVAKKFVVVSLIILYPMYVYGPLVNTVLNKPTQTMLGHQMKMSAVLDTYLARSGKEHNSNEYYTNMFGRALEGKDAQVGSYLVRFYTTSDKRGFDINEVDASDPSLSFREKFRIKHYRDGGEYPKEHLVSVDVALTDLYKWVWDGYYGGEGSKKGNGGHNSQEAESSVGTLFEWLAGGGSNFFKVTGYEPELASYTEYTEDTNRAAKSQLLNQYKETEGKKVKASTLFYDIVYNVSNEESISQNLGRLEELSKLVNNPEPEEKGVYAPSKVDMQMLIRDLSSTAETRERFYGKDGWSNFTSKVFTGGSNSIQMIDGTTLELPPMTKLEKPKEDFLELTTTVTELLPPVGNIKPQYRTKILKSISEINTGLLNNYLYTYSISKASLGDVEDPEVLNHAEKMVMATEAFFQVNDALGFSNFPTHYQVDGISFDKYLTLLFVPFKDYGQEILNFIDDNSSTPRSTAEYIAFSDNIWVLGIFGVAVIMLIVFGLAYLGVFYLGLLCLTMYNFIKYYIIKAEYENKSWLGSVVIMVAFGGVKAGLVGIWWLCSYLMNRSIAISPEHLPSYPTTLVHSVIIIAYLMLMLIFVFIPLTKSILSDKSNLGGQVFADKAKEKYGKLKAGGFGGKGIGGSGSSASRFNKRGLGKLRRNASRIGGASLTGLSGLRKTLRYGGRLTKGASGVVVSKAMETSAIRSVNSKLKQGRTGAVIRKTKGFINPKNVKSSNQVERGVMSEMATNVNAAGSTVAGVPAGKKVGEVLNTSDVVGMTKMTLNDAESALEIHKSLKEHGINSILDGTTVTFDSTGYNLTDVAVRKELFGEAAEVLQENYRSQEVMFTKGALGAGSRQDYEWKEPGEIQLGVGSSGLSGKAFQKLQQTKAFQDAFIPVDEFPDYNIGANGEIRGNVAVKLADPTMSGAQIEGAMQKIYQEDAKLRAQVGDEPREASNELTSAIRVDNMTEQQFNSLVRPLVAPSMKIQGSRVLYNSKDGEHLQAVNSIEKVTEDFNNGVGDTAGTDANGLLAFIARDGESQGIATETLSPEDDAILANTLYGGKIPKKMLAMKIKEGDQVVNERITEHGKLVSFLDSLHEKNDVIRGANNHFAEHISNLDANPILSCLKDVSTKDIKDKSVQKYLNTYVSVLKNNVRNSPAMKGNKEVQAKIAEIENNFSKMRSKGLSETSMKSYKDKIIEDIKDINEVSKTTGDYVNITEALYKEYLSNPEEAVEMVKKSGKKHRVDKLNSLYNNLIDPEKAEVHNKQKDILNEVSGVSNKAMADIYVASGNLSRNCKDVAYTYDTANGVGKQIALSSKAKNKLESDRSMKRLRDYIFHCDGAVITNEDKSLDNMSTKIKK